MRVLIVGCGYVGLPLGIELVRRGHEVTGLRRSDTGMEELRAAGILPVVADVGDPHAFDSIELSFDWVVYCVAANQGGPEGSRRVYITGLGSLIERLCGAPPSKLVYTSSTGVYAQLDDSVVDETRPAEPETATGRILADAEQIVLSAARAGFPGVVLRLAGIYGPGRGYWLKQVLAGEARIEGDGRRFLNMVHRDDVVGAILSALTSGSPGEVYNVVDDEPVSQSDLLLWLCQQLGKPAPASVPEDAVTARKRGITNKRVSNLRLKTKLGYVFRYPTYREGYGYEVTALPPPA